MASPDSWWLAYPRCLLSPPCAQLSRLSHCQGTSLPFTCVCNRCSQTVHGYINFTGDGKSLKDWLYHTVCSLRQNLSRTDPSGISSSSVSSIPDPFSRMLETFLPLFPVEQLYFFQETWDVTGYPQALQGYFPNTENSSLLKGNSGAGCLSNNIGYFLSVRLATPEMTLSPRILNRELNNEASEEVQRS